MPTGTVTITAVTGPGVEATAAVFENVKSIKYDFEKNMIFMDTVMGPGSMLTKVLEYSYEGVATITMTISGSTTTVSIS